MLCKCNAIIGYVDGDGNFKVADISLVNGGAVSTGGVSSWLVQCPDCKEERWYPK